MCLQVYGEVLIKELMSLVNPRDGTGINGFKVVNVHWSEQLDRDEQWAKDERARIGEERFRREHDCEFIAFDETLIDGLKLVALAGKDPYKTGQVRWYERPKGQTYVAYLILA